MHERVLATLQLSFSGLLALGCNAKESGDEEAAEGTDESSTDESSTDETSGDDGQDLLPACGEPPSTGSLEGPPTLLSAQFEDDFLLVRLTFSEPIAPVDEVDPASFRISAARYYGGYDYDRTYYWDPMLLFCSFTDGCFGDYTDVVELGCAEDDPAALLLRLDILHGQYLCPIFDYGAMYGTEYMLLPHFDASVGQIVDLDGEPLESIAAHWVQNDQLAALIDGNFPDYPMAIPIPCSL
jgi:hypothetical protein